MNRRSFFSFLPAAPIGMLMAAEAMAKTPPASMAPVKELMTLTAHKPPAPTPKYPEWSQTFIGGGGGGGSGRYLQVVDAGDGWATDYIALTQPHNIVLGEGMKIESSPNQFDEETKVAMSVGKDGHLWLKINDEWKRIVTE